MRHLILKHHILSFLILCTGIGLCINPCLANDQYFSGGPDLSISLDSSNQLIPGTTMQLPLVLENKGKITMEFYNANSIPPQYIPTTALFSTVQLVPGDSPVNVKSNPQIIGDIPAGVVVPAAFTVEIPQDAKAGSYTMQAIVTYQYVPTAEQRGTDNIEYSFKDAKKTLPVPVVVRKMVVLSVENTSSDNLAAGGDGYITFTIRNTGQGTGNHTSVFLSPDGASPVVPYDNGIYIGDLPPGGTAQSRFKVAVSGNANHKQTYPVTLYAVYRDFEGNIVTSPPVSTGVTFGEKVKFELTSAPSVIYPGKTGIITTTYKNTGNSTVYNAQARISVIDPFSSDDETAFLGNLKPGESAVALFSVQTDAGATIKAYSIDSEIAYTDSGNTAFTSDNIPVTVEVKPDSNTGLIVMVFLVVVIAAGAYLWYRKRTVSGRK